MMFILRLFLPTIFFLAIFLPTTAFAQTTANESKKVISIEIDADIRAGTAQFVKRALKEAEKEQADLFLINLNTPGGLLKSTEEISRLLLESKVKTAVFVHKQGGWAFSAGTFILLSAEIAAAHPESSIGAAQPRLFGLDEAPPPDEKVISATASWIKSIAEARGRNAFLAEKFVRENLTLSGKQALEEKIIDVTAFDTEDLLKKLNLQGSQPVHISPSLVENILSFLSIPQIVSLFFTIGVLGIILIFRTGELEVLGVIALLAFLLGLWGVGAVSLSALGVVLLILGVVLLAVELFDPGFGIFGVLGAISLLAGILFFGQEPFTSPIFLQTTTFFALGAALAVSFLFILMGRMAVGTLRTKPKSGVETLVGKIATASESLKPSGRVWVESQDWKAKSVEGNIKKGETVEIVDFSGNTLFVKGVKR